VEQLEPASTVRLDARSLDEVVVRPVVEVAVVVLRLAVEEEAQEVLRIRISGVPACEPDRGRVGLVHLDEVETERLRPHACDLPYRDLLAEADRYCHP